jgi:hypothetical protein
MPLLDEKSFKVTNTEGMATGIDLGCFCNQSKVCKKFSTVPVIVDKKY